MVVKGKNKDKSKLGQSVSKDKQNRDKKGGTGHKETMKCFHCGIQCHSKRNCCKWLARKNANKNIRTNIALLEMPL